jgi:hypothetical protein
VKRRAKMGDRDGEARAIERAMRDGFDVRGFEANLDTLAEAYYINGRYADALSTIKKAISEDGPQQSHFLKQKEKFEKALRGEIRSS